MENSVVKILAIDDNKDNLTILKALVMEAFPQSIVFTAFTGQKGLEIAEKEEPDVILLDIIMPGMDGYEVSQKLKADKKLCDIPVVFVTAIKSDKASRIMALECGAEAFLTKPIDESELTALIRAMIKVRASNSQKRYEMIRLEEKSQENEYRFQSLFDRMSSGVAIYKVLNNGSAGKDYIVMDFNKTALIMEGKKKNEVQGKSLYDLRPNIDDYGLIPAFQKVWLTGQPAIFPSKVYIDEKYHNWYENRIFKLPSGEIVAIYDDVTEKMTIQEKLEESEQKYREYIQNAPDGIFVIDETGQYLEVNRASSEITGYKKDEFLHMTVRDFLAPESLEDGLKHFKMLSETGKSSGVLQYKHKGGSTRWLSVDAVKLTDHRFLGFCQDITERIRMEKQLNQNFKDLLESQRLSHLGTWRLDLGTNQVVWSEELYKMYGFDPTLPPPSYTEHMKLFTPESWDRLSTSVDYTRTSGIPYELELETVTIDGSKGWLWARGEAETDLKGNITSLRGAAQDITERKKAEHALKSSNEQNQRIIDNLQDAYFQADWTGNIVSVNPAALKMFGYNTSEEMIGKPVISLYADVKERDRLIKILEEEGSVTEFITECVLKDGSTLWMSINAQFVRNEAGELVGTEGILRDISERVRFTEGVKQHRDVLAKRLLQSVNAISKIGEIRDAYTAGHQKRVAALSCAIGSEMGLSDEQINNLSYGGLIHDIGKFLIPSDILNKPGKVSALEYRILQTHVEESYNVVKEIDFPEQIHTMIHQHHERLDGSGYPRGLSGDDIILESRIMAVADVVEAMSSHRPYREALGIDAALEEISLHRGTKYDAEVVDACMKLFKEEGYALQYAYQLGG